MEIINEGFPKNDQVLVDEISIKYYQEPDCTEDSDGEGQEIVISTRDGGGGKFLNINTKSWSISDEKDLVKLLSDFKQRAGINE